MRHAATSIGLALMGIAFASPASAEVTKSFKIELNAPAGAAYTVENLAGSMTVTRGTGSKVVAVVTVHAESDAVLSQFKMEQVSGEKGEPTLRAIFPTSISKFRAPRGKGKEGSWLTNLISWGNASTVTYAGRKVTVSDSSGVLLYADIEVEVPSGAVKGTFRNLYGALQGTGLEGQMVFDVASADITLEDMSGTTAADAGSGNISATGIAGTFKADAGSGNITVTGFKGDSIECAVGSGNITAHEIEARSVSVNTGSGNIRFAEVVTQTFDANTGSGNVVMEAEGNTLSTVDIGTGSGNVTLQMDPTVSFEARAEMSSGDLTSEFTDAEPIREGKELVGYRRGDGHTRIKVSTGSGNVRLIPGRV